MTVTDNISVGHSDIMTLWNVNIPSMYYLGTTIATIIIIVITIIIIIIIIIKVIVFSNNSNNNNNNLSLRHHDILNRLMKPQF